MPETKRALFYTFAVALIAATVGAIDAVMPG
jgi:hypothetical protein